ncbi:threonine-phosphate decarboxylase CobD [Leptolyngbya sp. CCNP1308]|uniref:threonine-phosphate decarboxylase CobD n=1 Tax=Leptolyngbya sp. CCNP1308 TaxID=3110255 RepID=UPI002B220495|nr:threonine-phosphate decarboxylase CobD [Leptolyngbya sp. CCNP1308]MEA5452282.1 threonine-phosphate decarboxylase CobD [Leptolyngbya sp. CCNP1308]
MTPTPSAPTASIRPVHGGNLVWAAAVANCSPDSLVDFSASINPLGPPESVALALAEALGQLRHYPDPDYSALRQALADYHRVPADWVLPGNGAAELLTWAARDLAEGPAPVGCHLLTPAFGDYGRALESFGVPVNPWPLSLGKVTEDCPLQTAIPWPEAEVAGILINNPHNPTGRLWSVDSLKPLLDRADTVIVDEAFMDFVPPNQQQSLIGELDRYPNLVVLRSLTKFYTLPGLRIGYALGHPDRLHRWQHWRDPWPVNTLAAVAAIAAVQDKAFQTRTWDWLPPARTGLFEGLRAIPGLKPLVGAANYLLVRTTHPAPALQEAVLRSHQVLIRDCLSFPELGADYFRVAVRTAAENERLLTALGQAVAV